MENKKIISVGKFFFWLSFILGNICLFGYIISNDNQFAIGGYLLLMFGSIINLFVIVCLVVYGLINKSQLKFCVRASTIICINIPVAIIYFYIGTSLLNL
jgi:hypothetical protein